MVNEQELRKKFEASKDLQIEFGDDFEAFFALAKHEDEVAKRDERRDRHRANRPRDVGVDEPALKAEFAASADLRSEFGSLDSFLAFKKGDASGEVRKFETGCVSSEPGRSVMTSAPAPKKTETLAPGQKKT